MSYDVTPQQPSNGYKVAELFAGGGLMAVGLKTAGFNLVWANDFEKKQCEAYALNIGPHIVHGDITKIDIDSIPNTDIIAGGPPCQDFSVAGQGAGEGGERGALVWRYLEIIEKKRPKAFVFENVKGLIQKKHRHTFDALIEKFSAIGYSVSWKLINAWDYGVAQKRERVFIVGVRKDLEMSYEFPEPVAEDVRTQTLRDVIGDLPEPTANHKKDERLPNYVQNIVDGKSKSNFGQMPLADMDDAAYTMLASYGKKKPQQIYDQSRRFTVRECLRIQSVPDWYVFDESMSLSKMYEIVGNGVASRVAWYLGKALAEQLRAAEEAKTAKLQAAASFPVAFKIKPKVAGELA